MSQAQVFIDGTWVSSQGTRTFQAVNPATKTPLPPLFPVSPWDEIERAIRASHRAFRALAELPDSNRADFLERYAERLEARKAELVEMAHRETGLPVQPRLADVEFPRTVNQLRQAATAVRQQSWRLPVIDTKNQIRAYHAPVGPVVVFGPNNFPMAFNGIAGGDFAAAIAAGNPVIAKGHPAHPETTRLFAIEAITAAQETGLPAATVQLIYRTEHADGSRLVAHPLIGATGYTGARTTGLALKAAADQAGKPIYLELSSINPVVILPGALEERLEKLVDEFTLSCLAGTGQFCTNPGMVVLVAGTNTDRFLEAVRTKFGSAPVGTLLTEGVEHALSHNIGLLRQAGAEVLTGGEPGGGAGYCYRNTLLRVSGTRFLQHAEQLQTEAFGNCSLCVVADNPQQLPQILDHLEGNLTGTIYSATGTQDEELYHQVAPLLREKVGRLLNDKMPTGVAVSPAMNHGGPYPATGHAGFTSVGIPAAILRFTALQCFDAVREHRLPPVLQNRNPGGVWRCIDGEWTQGDLSS